MNDFYWLLLGVLAVWRVTHLLHAEDGPGRLLERLRRSLVQGFWSRLLDCFYCLSLWIAAPAAWWIGSRVEQRLFLWLVLSAGAILLERMTDRRVVVAAPYVESEAAE